MNWYSNVKFCWVYCQSLVLNHLYPGSWFIFTIYFEPQGQTIFEDSGSVYLFYWKKVLKINFCCFYSTFCLFHMNTRLLSRFKCSTTIIVNWIIKIVDYSLTKFAPELWQTVSLTLGLVSFQIVINVNSDVPKLWEWNRILCVFVASIYVSHWCMWDHVLVFSLT